MVTFFCPQGGHCGEVQLYLMNYPNTKNIKNAIKHYFRSQNMNFHAKKEKKNR